VAVRSADVSILGFLPHYFTGTNYLITPVVGLIEPEAAFVANPFEVQSIFEVPLGELRRETTYSTYDFRFRERRGSTWRVAHPDKLIWGITANLTRRFFETALQEDAP